MRKIFLLLAIVTVLSSCNWFGGKKVSGNGKIITQERKVSSFNSVEASGSLKVHIRQDSASLVRIETDDNLMEYIEIYVTGSTLVIKEKNGFNLSPSKDLIIYTSAPVYRSVDVSGAGDIISDNIISGGEPLEMSVSGSGSIKAFDLTTDISTLNLSGAADAEVTANQKLDVNVSGSGDVKYKGNASVSQSISGSGSVKKVS